MAINRTSTKKGKVVDIPDAVVTIGTPTAGDSQVSVAFTASSPATGGPVQKYTAISNPGSFTGTASTSPIIVTGLTNGTAYTFTVAAGNATGNNVFSSPSASVTPFNPLSFDSIATVAVGAGNANTITFSSIPSTYKHLQLRLIARTNRTGNSEANLLIRFNSDSSTNYSLHDLYGDGINVVSTSGTNYTSIIANRLTAPNATANVFGAMTVDIYDYTSTVKNKTIRALGGFDANGTGALSYSSGLWFKTPEAINRIDLTTIAGTYDFTQYSHFALYGIKG